MPAKLDVRALDRKIADDVRMLNAALADRKQHLEAVARCERSAVITAWRLGGRLIERKMQLGHGQWLPWLQRMGISERPAQTYMRLSREIRSASDLGPSIRATLRSLPMPESVEVELREAIAYAMLVWRTVRDSLTPGSDAYHACIVHRPDGPFSTVAWLDYSAALENARSDQDYVAAGALLPWRREQESASPVV